MNMNKWYIIIPGIQLMVESEKTFEEMFSSLMEQAKAGLITLEPKPGIRLAYFVSSHQHFQFNLLNEFEFNRMQAEQKYAIAQSQIGGRH